MTVKAISWPVVDGSWFGGSMKGIDNLVLRAAGLSRSHLTKSERCSIASNDVRKRLGVTDAGRTTGGGHP